MLALEWGLLQWDSWALVGHLREFQLLHRGAINKELKSTQEEAW